MMLGHESRAVDVSDWDLALVDSSATDSGVDVTTESALRLTAVYASVTLLADGVASLPVDPFRKDGLNRVEVPKPVWMAMPNPESTWRDFVERVMGSMLIFGNAYVLIADRDRMNVPTELWVLNPADVKVRRSSSKSKEFVWGEQEVFTHFTSRRPAGQVLHIQAFNNGGLVGLSPIEMAKQAIGLGLVTEKHGSKFFGMGSQPSGVIQMPFGSNPTPEQLTRLKELFERRTSGSNNAHRPIVLANGATWNPTSIPNDQAQFLETRKFTVAEIARLFRVPPHLIGGVERSTSWGSGIEEQNIAFVTYSLMPWITRLESGFNQFMPSGQYVKWNPSGLLRGDVSRRVAAYAVGVQNGWLSRNEVRHLEDLNTMEGLDDFLTPLNMSTGDPQ